jgi:hemolysin III
LNALTLPESTGTVEFNAATPVALLDHATLPAKAPALGRTATDEFLNTLTHGFGFLLAAAGAYQMSGRLAGCSELLALGCTMYLISLLGVYSMSTMSHGATEPRWKTFYRQLDQGFIYLLIVASYTPYSIAYLHGPVWTTLLCGMWVGAIAGFIAKVFLAHQVESVSVVPPLMLGWVPIVAMPTLSQQAPAGAFELIIAGGIFYTVGVCFFINDGRVKYFHAVWHVCVIAGSTCHFSGILNFVLAG